VEVTRSEEELRLTSAWRPVDRVRVRKRIVTEQRVVTVELRREELVVEREPLEEAPVVLGEAPPVPEPLVLTLSEEQAVITKVVVPLERVRISVDRVTEEHELRTTLRSEQVDVVQERPPA
jgi:uncharacterized protein (TIGR02271 family)